MNMSKVSAIACLLMLGCSSTPSEIIYEQPLTLSSCDTDAMSDAAQETSGDGGLDATSDATGDAVNDSLADTSADGATDASGDAAIDAIADAATAPYIRQVAQFSTAGANPQMQSQDQYCTLSQSVLPGSTVVAFITEYNINGSPPGSAPPSPITVTDTLSDSYVLLNTINDQADWQAVMSYTTYATLGGAVTVHAHFAGLLWQGLLLAEVANVSSSPLLAHAARLQNAASGSTNSVKTPSVSVNTTPALVLGFACNGSDLSGTPSAGTGWTSAETGWNWNGVENTATTPSALLEYKTVTSSSNVMATFTPANAGDNWEVFVLALH
jgi:hypothetical protein